jgi:hypothetical protein
VFETGYKKNGNPGIVIGKVDTMWQCAVECRKQGYGSMSVRADDSKNDCSCYPFTRGVYPDPEYKTCSFQESKKLNSSDMNVAMNNGSTRLLTDGNTELNASTCVQASDASSWMMIDMKNNFTVTQVVLHLLEHEYPTKENLTVSVIDADGKEQKCQFDANTWLSQGLVVITCNALVGDHVYLKPHNNQKFTVCEVEIYGYAAGPPSSPPDVTIEMTLTEKFTPELENSDSTEFKKLAEKVISTLNPVLVKKNMDGYAGVVVEGFRNGSTIAVVKVLFDSITQLNTTNVINNVQEAVQSGVLDVLGVSKEKNITRRVLTTLPPTTTKFNATTKYNRTTKPYYKEVKLTAIVVSAIPFNQSTTPAPVTKEVKLTGVVVSAVPLNQSTTPSTATKGLKRQQQTKSFKTNNEHGCYLDMHNTTLI